MVGYDPVSSAYISQFDVLQNRTRKLTPEVDPRNSPPMPKSVKGKPEALMWSIIMIVNVPYDSDQRVIYKGRQESLLEKDSAPTGWIQFYPFSILIFRSIGALDINWIRPRPI